VRILAGLEYNKLVEFHAKTDWQSENATVADALWDGIDISPITIAFSKKWAAEHGLPESNTFYWDEEKALYHIKGIHGMHCLVRSFFHSSSALLVNPGKENTLPIQFNDAN
jgi:hypothetical protein